jgi:hypothetical protein
MKTKAYNPSPLEVRFVNVIESLKKEINDKLQDCEVTSFDQQLDLDNPILKANIIDVDGDRHTIVLQVIQKPDASI